MVKGFLPSIPLMTEVVSLLHEAQSSLVGCDYNWGRPQEVTAHILLRKRLKDNAFNLILDNGW